ncbi:hypothetical protein NPIL_94191 [Nephila pilipes]|uniref:Uncharacterized protein n=1 Tax=Nephila pilipes TaxID=299642 RepID=A0A8X6NZU3_NEPPI|nr:hypothetical protein NPIL_94191 [Nephila pilipes]
MGYGTVRRACLLLRISRAGSDLPPAPPAPFSLIHEDPPGSGHRHIYVTPAHQAHSSSSWSTGSSTEISACSLRVLRQTPPPHIPPGYSAIRGSPVPPGPPLIIVSAVPSTVRQRPPVLHTSWIATDSTGSLLVHPFTPVRHLIANPPQIPAQFLGSPSSRVSP